MYIFMIGFYIAALIGILAALFAGKYPRGLFDFIVRFYRWVFEINMYMLCMSDKYPPFSPK